ncbi:MAG: hypothetical protein GY853_15325 [PVC group bacterium]|nr:hypothetical protein [PVC group bacterium]
MGGITRAYRQHLLNYVMGHTTAVASIPATCIALFTTLCSATSAGTEVTGSTGYARVTCPSWTSATAAEPAVIANATIATFATATGSWGDIVSVGIYDTITGGNYIAYGSLTATKTISANDVARFASGSLTVSLNES